MKGTVAADGVTWRMQAATPGSPICCRSLPRYRSHPGSWSREPASQNPASKCAQGPIGGIHWEAWPVRCSFVAFLQTRWPRAEARLRHGANNWVHLSTYAARARSCDSRARLRCAAEDQVLTARRRQGAMSGHETNPSRVMWPPGQSL